MRRLAVAFLAAAATIASASPPWSTDQDDVPRVTDPSVPMTFVGGDGSVSIGLNADGETEGQIMGVFARNDERATVGQLWWDRTGAGGAQADFNWLWGATAAEVREDPSKAAVARVSFAVAQNGEHNRKATLGFGFERREYSIDAYLSRGLGGGKNAGSVFHDETNPVTGSDDIGTWVELETTTIETLLESKAYDSEFGVQFSHVFDPLGMRVYGGAGIQDGDGDARANIFSVGVDSPLGRRGWAMSARAEHQRRDGEFEQDRSDTRLSFFLRYHFGGRGAFVPTSEIAGPAWVARALGRASNAAPRTVDSYRASRGSNVEVTHGPREYTNHFPLARADSAATFSGEPVTIDVLANDADPDGDALVISAVTQPANGSVAIAGDRLVYTPAPGFSGTDTLTYTVSDPEGGSGRASVTVTVAGRQDNQVPVARDDSVTTSFGTPITIAVLANDTDADDDDLTIIDVGTPAFGTAVLSGNAILYTPQPGFDGVDRFSYRISDGHGGEMSATVTVRTSPQANRPPVAFADAATTLSATPVAVAVLANDSDPDGDVLAIASVGAPALGTATIAGDAILYTPGANSAGIDRFPYTISDGRGGSATAMVTVTITATATNTPPVAVDDNVTTPFGTPVTVAVLANDYDADGDPLSISAVTAPASGSATIVGDTIVYAPNAVVVGVDTFTYTIEDGQGGSATATVSVTVGTAPNQPPIANDDAYAIDPSVAATLAVLANDSDPDGDPLAIESVSAPAFGTATINGNEIVYQADATFTGGDSFTYTINDGRGGTDTATVTITSLVVPNQPPVAVDDDATTPNDTPATIAVLANDSDPDGDPLAITAVGPPLFGTAAIAGTAILYTPPAGVTGTDTFTYTIEDGRGGSASATVRVVVGALPNQPPIAINDGFTIDPGVPATLDVLDNDSDPDGDPLTIIAVGAATSGTVAINGNLIIYQAGVPFPGNDSFTYTISDGRGGTDTATVTVSNTFNQPPVAADDGVVTAYETPVTIPVLQNDSDPENDPLVIVSTTQPANGTVTFNDSTVTYIPADGFTGLDTFTYTISDGRGGYATANVVVFVNA